MKTGTAEVVSRSKDSISVRWEFDDYNVGGANGSVLGGTGGYKFQIQYQAIGSNVVQTSRLLDTSASAYDITQLHENTNYDICVLRKRQTTSGGAGESPTWLSMSWRTEASACVEGTTSTDSLTVALGSTFGAFLALGLIVALVFIAKWQHSRRAKKRQQAAAEVAGNGAAAKADFDDDEPDDVLRVEIAELDASKKSISTVFFQRSTVWYSLA